MLRGQRVGLRHMTEDDLPWLKRVMGDPQVRGSFGGTRMTSPHEIDSRFREHGYACEDIERLLICHLLDGSVIGEVVHFSAARYTSAREIGWTMADLSMRGQGLTTEAAALLADYVFGNWPVNRLSCGMSVHNHASRRVAEKCGFKHEGTQRGIIFVAGQYVDCHSLSLLREDWQAMKNEALKDVRREFDLVVFGATGFTGRLVAEYLHLSGAAGARWAIAGRSLDKLAAVRDALHLPPGIALLKADAADAAALKALVARTRCVITTVGPYQLHGEPLATACASGGTDYVDLCGEPLWMARMIGKLAPLAEASGARIVFSCGFDSIPFELGVVYLQAEAQARFGAPFAEVRGRVARAKGALSGGTYASFMETVEAVRREPALGALMVNPFALAGGFKGPPQPDGSVAAFDDWADAWCGPFLMATINTKNIHRSNALRGHPWGQNFRYSEKMLTGRPGQGDKGRRKATALARFTKLQNLVLGFGPTRALLRHVVLTKPGDGPGPAAREAGHYELWFTGKSPRGEMLRAIVKGDRDPGYGSTCKLISEAALCLVQDVEREDAAPGGVWTPGSAMGLALVRRLQAHAGLSFAIA